MGRGDIRYIVTADTKKGKAAIKEFDQNVDKMGKTAQRAGTGFKSLAGGVAVGVAAFYAASKALRGVVQWMGDAIDKAAIQQTAEAEMRAALESTGREVEANAEHFKLYASELQSATKFGDEQILSAQALMIQLTKLDREGLDAATKGAIGLASVYKTDLQAATTLVGKALAGNYGALSRYGIMVERTATDEQKRASILEQLQVMYQRAKAETDTYQGAVKQLSNVYGDLKERIGDAVVKNEEIRDSIVDIREKIEDFIDSGKIEEWAAALSLHMSVLVEEGKKVSPIWKAWWAISPVKLFKDLVVELIGGADATDALAEANKKLLESLANLGREQITSLDLIHHTASEMLTAAERAEVFARAAELLSFKMEDVWDALKQPSGLMAEWEALFALVKTPELNLAMEQFAISAEDTFVSVMDSLGIFVDDSQAKGEQYKEVMTGMTKAQQEFSAIAIGELINMEAGLKGMVDAILNTLEKWALGAVVKSTMTLPFPANLIASAVAIGAVKAIFAGIKSMETGGTIEREGIYHLHPGEVVTPASNRVSNVYNQTTGGARFYSTVNIYAQRLDDRTINQASEKIFIAMNREAHRFGFKLNR